MKKSLFLIAPLILAQGCAGFQKNLRDDPAGAMMGFQQGAGCIIAPISCAISVPLRAGIEQYIGSGRAEARKQRESYYARKKIIQLCAELSRKGKKLPRECSQPASIATDGSE